MDSVRPSAQLRLAKPRRAQFALGIRSYTYFSDKLRQPLLGHKAMAQKTTGKQITAVFVPYIKQASTASLPDFFVSASG